MALSRSHIDETTLHVDEPPAALSRSDNAQTFWHSVSAEQVLKELEVEPDGLSKAEAERRRTTHGPNRLQIDPPVSAWKILVAQLRSLVVGLLFLAAGISLLLGDRVEASAIGAVLAVNTALGFWIEWRARRAMDGLRNLQVQEAVVRREGELHTLDATLLVPGDLIRLEAGSAVPADARLIETNELTTIEAPLTGESLPATKNAAPTVTDNPPESVPIGDRHSMVYKGTLVATGSSEAIVVGTGAHTEIGRISDLLQDAGEEQTPLEHQLDRLGRRLVGLVLALAVAVVGLGAWRGADLWTMVETGIALAVAAVPEGLPVVATITLAGGMRRMARRHALLRKLPSVETLGATTVICTDKTGTLTAGEMTVTTLYIGGRWATVTGSGYDQPGELQVDGNAVEIDALPGVELALRIATLTNHARFEIVGQQQHVEGDPTEAALLVLGQKLGVDRQRLAERLPTVAEIPFSSDRMLMATFHRGVTDLDTVYVKGAPKKLVDLSAQALEGEQTVPLDAERRERLLDINRQLAGRGLRVLALAVRSLPNDELPTEDALHDLTFVGFVGLMDPPAPRVQQTVERLRHAGIRTVMITGDQLTTAEAVGKQLGVLQTGDQTLDGRELASLSGAELATQVEEVTAFARTSPEDKLRIVRAFQQHGEIVGMLGDGVNDAPALKQADIGVAMGGRGTDVAKETADMVLSDDSFETVAAAVEEGRVVFDNIRKFVFYLFSCNLSEALVVVASVVAGLPLPLAPLQILWLNLITDVFPALALAMEPAEPGIMHRPPRDPRAAILSRSFVTQIVIYGLLMTAATLAAFVWALRSEEADLRRPMTIAFMTLALTQLLHVFNARSSRSIAFGSQLGKNRWIWRAWALTILLQLAAIYLPPLAAVLQTTPLGVSDWMLVAIASAVPLVFGQVAKARSGLRSFNGSTTSFT